MMSDRMNRMNHAWQPSYQMEKKNRIMNHLAPSESNTRAIMAVNKMSTREMNHDDNGTMQEY